MADQALLDRARSGDATAFAELVAPYRRELHVHCYRMLGSFDDADDALQETLVAAWRGLAAFQAKASVRTWLYRIATNTCLNLVRKAARRPQMTQPLPITAPAPTGSNEVTWLQPYPDTLLDDLPDDDPGPEARAERNEAVSLAFVAALQLLSSRARAVLILRDVLGFTAREAAGTLGSTEEAVAMTLSRARATLREHTQPPEGPQARAGTAAQERMARRGASVRPSSSRKWRSGWSHRPGSSKYAPTGSQPWPSTPATGPAGSGAAAGFSSSPCEAIKSPGSPASSHTPWSPSACRASCRTTRCQWNPPPAARNPRRPASTQVSALRLVPLLGKFGLHGPAH